MMTPSAMTVSSSAPRSIVQLAPISTRYADTHAARLANLHPTLGPGRETEAIAANDGLAVDHAVIAQRHAVVDNDLGKDPRTLTERHVGPDLRRRRR